MHNQIFDDLDRPVHDFYVRRKSSMDGVIPRIDQVNFGVYLDRGAYIDELTEGLTDCSRPEHLNDCPLRGGTGVD